MKTNILTTILILAAGVTAAQQPVVVSIGAGMNNSSSSLKKDAYLGNGYNISGDVFVPLSRKGWDGSIKGSGKLTFGIVAGGSYFTAKSLTPELSIVQATYKLYNTNVDFSSAQKGSAINSGFTASAGLQADIALGQFTLSPAIRAGYFSLKQDGFEQRGSAMINGSSQTIVLTESPEVRNTGFTAIPQLKISYPVASNLSIYTAAAMNLGPTIKSTQSNLVPAGGWNEKNTYEPMQLSSGKMVDQVKESNYQSMAINVGLSWSFGRSSKRLRGKVTKPGDNGMIQARVAGQPIGGIVVKGGKNPGGNMMVIQTNDKGELTLKGLEAGSYSFRVTGQPIGGIVVKGGKNPGGNMMVLQTDEKGEFIFQAPEAGDYKFTLTTANGKSISEKGLK